MSSSSPRTRLFVSDALAEGVSLVITGKRAHYLLQVMRLKPQDAIALFNGVDGEWRAEIAKVSRREVTVRCDVRLRKQTGEPPLTLCFAPIKFGRIDYLAQKATELGVTCLQPVMTERTIVTRINQERLRANAIEAAEQSERLTVPEVCEPLALPALLATQRDDMSLLHADETGSGMSLLNWAKDDHLNRGTLALLIGPEGGFSKEERAMIARCQAAVGVGLGPRVLRADTAAIAALAAMQCLRGDWDAAPSFNHNIRPY